ITNMGAELGATTSVFPSDGMTRVFMTAQGRAKQCRGLEADRDAGYDEIIDIDLSRLVPLVAQPHSPDKVVEIKVIEGLKVDQVAIGSCTNSSYKDMTTVAKILKGRKVSPETSLVISPGSRQVLNMISKSGALSDMLTAGARILETACGPCIGMGQAPASAAVSIRTYNRNFEGRSGTPDAGVYLLSPETAAFSAIKGVITDPRKMGRPVRVTMPRKFVIDDSMIIPPSKRPETVEVVRGPNIKPLPRKEPLADGISGPVVLKVGDNITTDHIMPAGAKILPLRSNIPAIAEHVFERVDPEFAKRAKASNGGFIVGGSNYGQGSSREHAALAPMYLGIKAVVAKSFARIHYANLVNFGILPLVFANEADYGQVSQGDTIEIKDIKRQIKSGDTIRAAAGPGKELVLKHSLTPRQAEIILAGGLLNYTVKQNV
ncbi:MAG: aconitase family protein, partial [Deltaproteobacteria bacterium]|nr:aconitase family protein [Deltaproteobacteria bacterium]